VEAALPIEPALEVLADKLAALEQIVRQQAVEIERLQWVIPQQAAEIQRLEAVVAQQAAEIERLRAGSGPGKNPQNSSLPPASTPPPNRPIPALGKKRGAKAGHRGTSRRRCQPDRVIERRPERCCGCGGPLAGVTGWVAGRSQQVELPPVTPVVVELVRFACRCPHCGTKNMATPPEGWNPQQRFGPRLHVLLAYLHHHHHVAYRRLRQLLRDLLGLAMSEGAIAASLARVAKRLSRRYAAIREQVRGSPVVGSDETRQRVAGQSRWSWVVQTKEAAYHWVGASRATKELVTFFGEKDPVLPQVQVCDLFSAQLASPVPQKQVCQAHQLRDLLYAEERGDRQYAPRMARLIRLAIGLARRRGRLPAALYEHQVQRLKRWGRALGWELRTDNAFGQALQERYQRWEGSWWRFLERADVEPTNNASERDLREVVVHRKVTGGFRSEWGAEGYARFTSVTQTARKQGQSLFPTLLDLLAPHPALIPE